MLRLLFVLSLTLSCTALQAQNTATKAKDADTQSDDSDSLFDNSLSSGNFSVLASPLSSSVSAQPSASRASGAAISTSNSEPAEPATLETIAPNRLVVVYRGGAVPSAASAMAARAKAQVISHMPSLGLSSLHVNGDVDTAVATLLAEPEVTAVLHDRYVKVARLQTQSVPADPANFVPPPTQRPIAVISRPAIEIDSDLYYNSPQGWATQAAGGYGLGLPTGTTTATGPWNTSMGAGARIAILDSGVDAVHPDIAPNLVFNLSEVDQTAMPSVCDDGTPQDQAGHGTFTASLAAGALGMNTGEVAGVAPRASILNIKVVERMPGAGTDAASQCEAGEASGLMSWVLQGIQDAITNHANVISASLGTLVDSTTGDGAGWIAEMSSVTYAAQQAGVVFVAAAGNNAINLAGSNYVDLPGQARGVLAVVASTNPACAENTAANATCVAGPVKRAYYSNYGGSVLNAIAAPGGSVPASSATGVTGFVRGACSNGLPNTTDGLPSAGQSYGCFNFGHAPYVQAIGTSASTPLVAGAAAVLASVHPNWTPSQIISALQSTATTEGSMLEPELNLSAALQLQ